MNAVEIADAVSALAERPFDAAEFPFQFLEAFGNKETTIKRLRAAKGSTNASDLPGALLQRNNIHIAVAAPGEVSAAFAALKVSPATPKAKAQFILATDGDMFEAEDLASGETVACPYADLRLQASRHLPVHDRAKRGVAEYLRWHRNGCDFLAGATFYRDRGNAPMAALLLHQACEHFYQCVLWSITLHGPRTHALDELREAAEALDARLCSAWPRDSRFERRAFGCIRRAYVEARYGRSYRISPQELAWAFARVEILAERAACVCADHQASLVTGPPAPTLPPPTERIMIATLPQPIHRANMLQRTWRVVRRARPLRVRWNRLIPVHRLGRSGRFMRWVDRIPLAMIGLCFFMAGAETLWRVRSVYPAQAARSKPADPSAVLDFNVRADTVLGAVTDIAERAGYRVKANEDIWAVRWTGAYRAKATTFDALADILYGSGLCPTIRNDIISVRYCDKSRPPIVATVEYEAVN